MLVFDNTNGMITEIQDTKDDIYWCIFVYRQGEDKNKIIDECPLIYKSYKDLDQYLHSKSGKADLFGWLDNDYDIVIRKVEMKII